MFWACPRIWPQVDTSGPLSPSLEPAKKGPESTKYVLQIYQIYVLHTKSVM